MLTKTMTTTSTTLSSSITIRNSSNRSKRRITMMMNFWFQIICIITFCMIATAASSLLSSSSTITTNNIHNNDNIPSLSPPQQQQSQLQEPQLSQQQQNQQIQYHRNEVGLKLPPSIIMNKDGNNQTATICRICPFMNESLTSPNSIIPSGALSFIVNNDTISCLSLEAYIMTSFINRLSDKCNEIQTSNISDICQCMYVENETISSPIAPMSTTQSLLPPIIPPTPDNILFPPQAPSVIPNIPCTLCRIGEYIGRPAATIPAGTISLISENDELCFRVEFQAVTSQYTPFQCFQLQLSKASSICQCTTIPPINVLPTRPSVPIPVIPTPAPNLLPPFLILPPIFAPRPPTPTSISNTFNPTTTSISTANPMAILPPQPTFIDIIPPIFALPPRPIITPPSIATTINPTLVESKSPMMIIPPIFIPIVLTTSQQPTSSIPITIAIPTSSSIAPTTNDNNNSTTETQLMNGQIILVLVPERGYMNNTIELIYNNDVTIFYTQYLYPNYVNITVTLIQQIWYNEDTTTITKNNNGTRLRKLISRQKQQQEHRIIQQDGSLYLFPLETKMNVTGYQIIRSNDVNDTSATTNSNSTLITNDDNEFNALLVQIAIEHEDELIRILQEPPPQQGDDNNNNNSNTNVSAYFFETIVSVNARLLNNITNNITNNPSSFIPTMSPSTSLNNTATSNNDNISGLAIAGIIISIVTFVVIGFVVGYTYCVNDDIPLSSFAIAAKTTLPNDDDEEEDNNNKNNNSKQVMPRQPPSSSSSSSSGAVNTSTDDVVDSTTLVVNKNIYI